MSQNDFNIANQDFPATRADINSAFQAAASNSSGATEPTTTYDYQLWADTSTNLLKMRKGSNWLTLAHFDFTNNRWEPRANVFQALTASGFTFKNSSGTTRLTLSDTGLLQLGSDLDLNSHRILESAEVTIASASALALTTASDKFYVTGTTAISSFTGAPPSGTEFTLRFAGALTLTYSATTNKTQTLANITTTAGDVAYYRMVGTVPTMIGYARQDGAGLGGSAGVLQRVSYTTAAVQYNTGTTGIPTDDTIPQKTEGDQYFSLAITPQSATSTLVIDVFAHLASSTSGWWIIGSIFQDATANALSTTNIGNATNDAPYLLRVRHEMTSGTTSATTFKFRGGGSSGATPNMTLNGIAGSRKFGGALISGMTITEYA